MLLAEGRERFKEDMRTMRLMADSSSCGASSSLGFNNVDIAQIFLQRGGGTGVQESSTASAAAAGPPRKLPVQLELLPLHPSSSSSPHSTPATPAHTPSPFTKNLFSWQQHGSRTNSGSGCEDGEAETYSSGGQGAAAAMAAMAAASARGRIDVNRLPLTMEFDEEEAELVSSPSSSGVKRERESRTHELLELERERAAACDHVVSSRGGSDEEDGGANARKKLRLSKEQSALLEESFKHHSTLNPKQKNALAKQLNLRPRQVEVWFQNRRARTKLKQTEVDCELLKRCCETLTIENRRLQKELQELRAIKATPPCVITHDFYSTPLPAATLTMCPSCERVATVDNRSVTFSKPGYSHLSHSPAAC